MPDRRIFVSYRRDDAAAHAGRLHDQLTARSGPGNVFMDIDTIQPGDDFVEAIARAIDSCDVFLLLVGPRWLASSDADGRPRLDNPDDYVRIEVQTALTRSIRVIPLLVQGARMPASDELPAPLRTLARRQAFDLSDQRWKRDVAELVERLDGPGGTTQPIPLGRPNAGTPAPCRSSVPVILLAAAGVLLLGLAAVVALLVWNGSAAIAATDPGVVAPPTGSRPATGTSG